MAIAISISAAYVESRRQGINTDNVLDMAIAAILGGIAGARIGWVLTSPDVAWYLVHPLQVIAIWNGGLSYFGAIIGGVIAAHWVSAAGTWTFGKWQTLRRPCLHCPLASARSAAGSMAAAMEP